MAEKKKPTRYDRTKGGERQPVQLLPTKDQHATMRKAAAAEGKPLATFLIDLGMRESERINKREAEKILKNSAKSA